MAKVQTFLLTRPKAQSERLAADIAAFAPDTTRCVISPALEIVFSGSLPNTVPANIIFTSANGVRAYIAACGPTNRNSFCVGDKTAALAREYGLTTRSAGGDAVALIDLIAKSAKGEAMLHIHGEHNIGNIAEKLSDRGIPCQSTVLYKQNALPLTAAAVSALSAGEITGLPLFSPRTARVLRPALDQFATREITTFCLSKNIAVELDGIAFKSVQVSTQPNNAAMLTLLKEFLG